MVPYYFHTPLAPSFFLRGGGAAADKEKGEPITLSAGTPFRFRGEPERERSDLPPLRRHWAFVCPPPLHSPQCSGAAAVVFLPGEIWKAKQEQVGEEHFGKASLAGSYPGITHTRMYTSKALNSSS